MKIHPELAAWEPLSVTLGAEPRGFRDLMWCPYLNEPAILKYDGDGRPTCVCCDGNFEAETHLFMGHIFKPSFATSPDAPGIDAAPAAPLGVQSD